MKNPAPLAGGGVLVLPVPKDQEVNSLPFTRAQSFLLVR